MEPLPIDNYRVGEHARGLTLSCISLRNRRAAGHPLLRFLFQRDVEAALWGRTSSGPLWKVLNQSGLGATALQVGKATVAEGVVLPAEAEQIMKLFRQTADPDMIDPCSLGRIRMCTLLPLSTAAAIARTFGRSANSMAFLRAFSQDVPRAWELHDEHERNQANREVDFVLEAELEACGDFEAEDLSFAVRRRRSPNASRSLG